MNNFFNNKKYYVILKIFLEIGIYLYSILFEKIIFVIRTILKQK